VSLVNQGGVEECGALCSGEEGVTLRKSPGRFELGGVVHYVPSKLRRVAGGGKLQIRVLGIRRPKKKCGTVVCQNAFPRGGLGHVESTRVW